MPPQKKCLKRDTDLRWESGTDSTLKENYAFWSYISSANNKKKIQGKNITLENYNVNLRNWRQ